MDGVTKAEMSDMPMIDVHDGDEGGGTATGGRMETQAR